jgi:P-type Ca2+ transporter type 2C
MGATAALCYALPWGPAGPLPVRHARALAFSVLAISPLFHALNCRSSTASIVALRPLVSLALVAAIAISGAVHLIAVLVPPLRPVFQTYPLSGREVVALLVLSMSIVPAVELYKLGWRAFARAAPVS